MVVDGGDGGDGVAGEDTSLDGAEVRKGRGKKRRRLGRGEKRRRLRGGKKKRD